MRERRHLPGIQSRGLCLATGFAQSAALRHDPLGRSQNFIFSYLPHPVRGHLISGTVGATTLSAAQLATHDHYTVYSKEDGHYNNYGQQTALYNGRYYNNSAVLGEDKVPDTMLTSKQRVSGSTSLTHTHSLTGAKSGSASSLPPYYALAFIMRCA